MTEERGERESEERERERNREIEERVLHSFPVTEEKEMNAGEKLITDRGKNWGASFFLIGTLDPE